MSIKFSTSVTFFRWRPACWLRVTGDDAATFLQGQFTNDLRTLPAGGAVYGLWLTLKGKVQADSFVLRGTGTNEFWLGSYFSSSSVIRERLESHVIADDVMIEDATAAWTGISVVGEGAKALLGRDAETGGFAFPGRRARGENVEWVHRAAEGEPDWLTALAGRELDAAAMERRRIAAGIPAIPRDLGLADLPNEAALEAEAISYTKGCYLGQEVMARLKAMGQVRRRLLRVHGAGEAPSTLPAAVFAGARQVGEVRSAVSDPAGGWDGLAMVSLLQVGATTPLALAADGASTVRLQEAP